MVNNKIFIVLLLIFTFFLVSCDSNYVLQADTTSAGSEPTTIIEKVIVEDNTKILVLEKELSNKELELQQYKNLINNLNSLLSNVYYGYASNDNYIIDGFTAFSINYNDKYYIITAGHAVEDINSDIGRFYNHKFKVNNKWIYPKLLAYENDFKMGKDYAIFYSDKITNGFEIGKFELPVFVLGYGKLNTIKEIEVGIPGESGSPIINLNGEVVGIMISGITDIKYVTKTIDNF